MVECIRNSGIGYYSITFIQDFQEFFSFLLGLGRNKAPLYVDLTYNYHETYDHGIQLTHDANSMAIQTGGRKHSSCCRYRSHGD